MGKKILGGVSRKMLVVTVQAPSASGMKESGTQWRHSTWEPSLQRCWEAIQPVAPPVLGLFLLKLLECLLIHLLLDGSVLDLLSDHLGAQAVSHSVMRSSRGAGSSRNDGRKAGSIKQQQQ